MSLAAALAAITAHQAPAQSGPPLECGLIPPRVLEARLAPAAGGGCPADEEMLNLWVHVERICYETGLEEVAEAKDVTVAKSKVVRVRRGSEVWEKTVMSIPTVSRVVEVSRSLDTINLGVRASVCRGAEGMRIASGTWQIQGYDLGSVFTAEGFFPTDTVWMLPDAVLGFGFDLPPVALNADDAPRRIAGEVAVPLPMIPAP